MHSCCVQGKWWPTTRITTIMLWTARNTRTCTHAHTRTNSVSHTGIENVKVIKVVRTISTTKHKESGSCSCRRCVWRASACARVCGVVWGSAKRYHQRVLKCALYADQGHCQLLQLCSSEEFLNYNNKVLQMQESQLNVWVCEGNAYLCRICTNWNRLVWSVSRNRWKWEAEQVYHFLQEIVRRVPIGTTCTPQTSEDEDLWSN